MPCPSSAPRLLVLALLSFACSSPSGSGTADATASAGTTTEPTTATSGPLPASTTTLDTEAMTSVADSGDTTSGATTRDLPLLDVPPPDELPPGCTTESTDFMFLLDDVGGLHRFDPDTLLVELLGALACPGGTTPLALTIDRGGTLWALMADDLGSRVLYTIDPDTLACELTSFVDPLPAGFAAYALAFAADAPDSEDETLYLTGLLSSEPVPSPDTPAGLARVDARTLAVETIGALPLPNEPAYELCDLKGSGDARLYAFCSTMPATVAEVAVSDASFVQAEPLDIDTGVSAAFAVWEGAFWLFTSTAPGGTSQVSTWAFGEDGTALVVDDLGLVIVGAANSTCVPYEPAG